MNGDTALIARSQRSTAQPKGSDPGGPRAPATPSWREQVEYAIGSLPTVSPGDPRKVGSELHALLRTYIVRGIIAPGTVLSQVIVANDLKVSRTPVREAIRMLQEEGLVVAEANLRARVAGIGYGELEALYASRIMIESLALGVSIDRNREGDIERIESCLQVLGDLHPGDVNIWADKHREFHLALYHHAGPTMLAMIQANIEKSERYQYLRWREQAPRNCSADGGREHVEILRACQDRNIAAGVRSLTLHLARTALDTLNDLSPDREPKLIRQALSITKAAT